MFISKISVHICISLTLLGLIALSEVKGECQMTGGVCAKNGGFALSCSETGGTMSIYSATLYATKNKNCSRSNINDSCKAADVTQEVRSACNGKANCTYGVPGGLLDNCKIDANGQYLTVAYLCDEEFHDICTTEKNFASGAILYNKHSQLGCECDFNGEFHISAFGLGNQAASEGCINSISVSVGNDPAKELSNFHSFANVCVGKKQVKIRYNAATDTCNLGLQIKGNSNLAIHCKTVEPSAPVTGESTVTTSTTTASVVSSTSPKTTSVITNGQKTVSTLHISTSTATQIKSTTSSGLRTTIPLSELNQAPTTSTADVSTDGNSKPVTQAHTTLLSQPVLIGILVGGGVTVLILFIIAVVLCRRNKSKDDTETAVISTPMEEGLQSDGSPANGKDSPYYYYHQYDTLNNVQEQVKALQQSSPANGDLKHSSGLPEEQPQKPANGAANGNIAWNDNKTYSTVDYEDDDDDDDDPNYAKLPPRKYSRGAITAAIAESDLEQLTQSAPNLKERSEGDTGPQVPEIKSDGPAAASTSTVSQPPHPLAGAENRDSTNEVVYAQPNKLRNSASATVS